MANSLKRATALVAGLAALAIAVTLAFPGSAHAYTQKETIVNSGHGSCSPSYLVIHETANPGASAYNHMLLYSRGYSYAVQYVMELDGSVVYHCMSDNRKAWAVGNGNSRCVNLEIAHATNRSDFNKQWSEAVKWAGDYLNKRGWSINQMICHNDARLKWGGTDHTDPLAYFSSYGKSWSQFKQAVADYMGTGTYSGTDDGDSEPAATASNGSSTSMGVYAVTARSGLNVRAGAGTGYRVLKTYTNGTRFDLYEVSGSWGRTPSGWINLAYTTYGGGSASTASSGKSAGTYTFKTTVNVRTGAGTGYRAVATYKPGGTVRISSVTEAGGYYWGRYTAYSGNTRYVALGVVGGKDYAY